MTTTDTTEARRRAHELLNSLTDGEEESSAPFCPAGKLGHIREYGEGAHSPACDRLTAALSAERDASRVMIEQGHAAAVLLREELDAARAELAAVTERAERAEAALEGRKEVVPTAEQGDAGSYTTDENGGWPVCFQCAKTGGRRRRYAGRGNVAPCAGCGKATSFLAWRRKRAAKAAAALAGRLP